MKYIIITPAKDEESYIEKTLKSICRQTLRPARWIIVNDGSVDKTGQIVARYMKEHSWIQLIDNKSIDKRRGGANVVRLFYKGYDSIKETKDDNFDFIVKLDADLTLPGNYFEEIAKCFQEDKKIGLCGGYIVSEKKGKFVKEKVASYAVRGAFKAYRKECFDDIGGLKPTWSWDGLDQMTMLYLGWRIKVLPLKVIHHRPTSKEYNLIKHRRTTGKEYYRNGYYIDLALLKAIYFLLKKPFFLGALAFLGGYITAFFKKEKKNIDDDLAKFIRGFQYRRIKKIFTIFSKTKMMAVI